MDRRRSLKWLFGLSVLPIISAGSGLAKNGAGRAHSADLRRYLGFLPVQCRDSLRAGICRAVVGDKGIRADAARAGWRRSRAACRGGGGIGVCAALPGDGIAVPCRLVPVGHADPHSRGRNARSAPAALVASPAGNYSITGNQEPAHWSALTA